MNVKIKIEEITLEQNDIYIRSSYPHTGFFVVNNSDIFWASTNIVWNCGSKTDFFIACEFKETEKIPEPEKQQTLSVQSSGISEDFVLKLFAIREGQQFNTLK